MDDKTGEAFTNIRAKSVSEAKDILDKDSMLFVQDYDGFSLSDIYWERTGTLPMGIRNTMDRTLEGRIAVTKSAPDSNPLIVSYHDFKKTQKTFWILITTSILALIGCLLTFKKLRLHGLSFLDRIPVDIRIGAAAGVSLLVFACTAVISQNILFTWRVDWMETIFCLFIGALFAAFAVWLWRRIFVRLNSTNGFSEEVNGSLTVKTLNGLKDVFLDRSIGFQMFFLLGLVFFMGGVLAVTILHQEIVLLLFGTMLIAVPAAIILLKRTSYFNRIVASAADIAAGRPGPDLPVKGKSAFARLAESINKIKSGVEISQNEQAKSERLKTELITNVSHDLRTPLTSIITYTELLKNDQVSESERVDYMEIIDRKSKRLKVLIDDLFEASKMASGNVDLERQKVDIVQLLQQALAEHDEKIAASPLTFRVNAPETPVFAAVDGQKLWRVFDNLIGNILKYSLDNTRVFVSLSKEGNDAVLAFKNTTKYELSENVDELFERFKRGDESRHTEGSGLGLAIAKSIVDLHGGSMEISVDGDLFKVLITLKLIA
ncbi:sensor histidine kinase [Bacillus massilinigeriensis]|uniref:sensor histidine kinase n=1 Tax=Bacillus mediterraneensis TaxID=1805474 RepID=UPI000AF52D57|nr:HAMP domain-containing sensor histidine kinase [Bacillus mediterraneensis]